jgi:hypothetical protein
MGLEPITFGATIRWLYARIWHFGDPNGDPECGAALYGGGGEAQ